MVLKHGDDRVGDADDAATGLGLGRAEEHFAGRSLHVGGPDSDCSPVQVDVAAPERRRFAPAQAGEGGEEHQGVEPAVMGAVGATLTGHHPQRPLGLGPGGVHLG